MRLFKDKLPDNSILHYDSRYTYSDTYSIYVTSADPIPPEKLAKAFFTCAPEWVDKLFTLRNKLVGKLGLKTSISIEERDALLQTFTCTPGERIGLFAVFDRTTYEVLLGEDDRHLDFRISIYSQDIEEPEQKKKISLSTGVKFNNRFGKIYFFLIRPFHRLIVPIMLKKMVEQVLINVDENKR